MARKPTASRPPRRRLSNPSRRGRGGPAGAVTHSPPEEGVAVDVVLGHRRTSTYTHRPEQGMRGGRTARGGHLPPPFAMIDKLR
jgi:hypothetical protein